MLSSTIEGAGVKFIQTKNPLQLNQQGLNAIIKAIKLHQIYKHGLPMIEEFRLICDELYKQGLAFQPYATNCFQDYQSTEHDLDYKKVFSDAEMLLFKKEMSLQMNQMDADLNK